MFGNLEIAYYPPLTPASPGVMVELYHHAALIAEEAHMSRTLSTLTDARDEFEAKLREIEDALSELQSTHEEIENAIEQLESVIGTLEELDGLSVNADVEVSVDVSIYL